LVRDARTSSIPDDSETIEEIVTPRVNYTSNGKTKVERQRRAAQPRRWARRTAPTPSVSRSRAGRDREPAPMQGLNSRKGPLKRRTRAGYSLAPEVELRSKIMSEKSQKDRR
jgi:hypothetical protein